VSTLLACLAAFEALGLVLGWVLCLGAAHSDSVAREALQRRKEAD
jgi:uncharacterized membrane protein YciS (DUF1049 family)